VSLDSQPPAGPQVGSDEWVARQAQRREHLPSWLGRALPDVRFGHGSAGRAERVRAPAKSLTPAEPAGVGERN